jgi:hypothetical protein
MEGFYKDLGSKLPVLEQKHGVRVDDYRHWLKKRQDNQSNRLEWLMYTELVEQAGAQQNGKTETETPHRD